MKNTDFHQYTFGYKFVFVGFTNFAYKLNWLIFMHDRV